jgi:hypothetical protein
MRPALHGFRADMVLGGQVVQTGPLVKFLMALAALVHRESRVRM